MAEFRTLRLEATTGGMNRDDVPSALPKNQARRMTNLLSNRRGQVRMRGGISAGKFLGNLVAPSGYIAVMDKVLYGGVTMAAAGAGQGHIEPQQAPWIARGASTSLAKDAAATAASIRVVDLNPVTPTIGTATAIARQKHPGHANERFGKFGYAQSFDSALDTVANVEGIQDMGNGYFERMTRLLRWDSTASPSPVVLTYAPKAAQDIRIWYNRLLVLGGTAPNAFGFNFVLHNSMWFTRPLTTDDRNNGIGNADVDYTRWTDEVSALTNEIQLLGDDGDFGVGFGAVGRNLAIFKRNQILLLTGFGPESFAVRLVHQNIGCLDPRSIVEVEEGCFFLSREGYQFFDGVQVRPAGVGIQQMIADACEESLTETLRYNGDGGGFGHAVKLDREHILLSIGTKSYGVGATGAGHQVFFCGLLHTPTGAWTLFRMGTNVVTNSYGGFWLLGRTERHAFGTDDNTHISLDDVPKPESQSEALRGTDQSQNFRIEWFSRVAELATPTRKATLHRIMIDYEFVQNGTSEVENAGPVVEVFDGTLGLIATLNLDLNQDLAETDEDTTMPPYRKRWVRDLYSEVTDIQVRVRHIPAVPANAAYDQISIHDVWIEYSPGQERHVGA